MNPDKFRVEQYLGANNFSIYYNNNKVFILNIWGRPRESFSPIQLY